MCCSDPRAMRRRARDCANCRPRVHAGARRPCSGGWSATACRLNNGHTERRSREELAVRRRRRKRLAAPRVPRPVIAISNDTCGIDFVSDHLASGSRLRLFTVVDRCRCESPDLDVTHSPPSEVMAQVLGAMMVERGEPARLYNCGALRSGAFDAWREDRGVEFRFI